jgi:hypothetical protein
MFNNFRYCVHIMDLYKCTTICMVPAFLGKLRNAKICKIKEYLFFN